MLLNRDPLPDIHNSRSIEAVIRNGKLLHRPELDAMLAKARILANLPDAGAPGKRTGSPPAE